VKLVAPLNTAKYNADTHRGSGNGYVRPRLSTRAAQTAMAGDALNSNAVPLLTSPLERLAPMKLGAPLNTAK
jgi:hypothetical protein